MSDYSRLHDHEKFERLAALAHSGTLTKSDWSELKSHLQTCKDCGEGYDQYQILTREWMPLLAARFSNLDERELRQEIPTPNKLIARVRVTERGTFRDPAHGVLLRIPVHPLVRAAVAACFTIVVSMVSYHWDSRSQTRVKVTQTAVENASQKLAAEKNKALVELLDSKSEKVVQLQREIALRERNLTTLRGAISVLRVHTDELAVEKNSTDEQLQVLLRQREALSNQFREAEQTYQSTLAELANVRTELDSELLQTGTDASRINELSALNLDYERRLENDEQYLASDRDVRELMGARKLYIADVYDIDSHHTQRSFGRAFYTQGKSLLFYAFDLDLRPDLTNVSTFQAWGRREADPNEPLNLGVFYIDSVLNRRWALRFDDPKQLAEIDSVFVTVEPHGGSPKPTGKPFLYALLRGQANHP
jgi:hypothetical protein